MVCEDNIQCSDCARKSQFYYCYPNQTCANIECPDPPTTTSSTTTTACPCPFANCGPGCGPFRFCPAGKYFDCVDCECKEGTTLPPFTSTTTQTTTTTTSTTTSTTTTTACPCPVTNCGCPYGPTVNCGDGKIFDCDLCECIEPPTCPPYGNNPFIGNSPNRTYSECNEPCRMFCMKIENPFGEGFIYEWRNVEAFPPGIGPSCGCPADEPDVSQVDEDDENYCYCVYGGFMLFGGEWVPQVRHGQDCTAEYTENSTGQATTLVDGKCGTTYPPTTTTLTSTTTTSTTITTTTSSTTSNTEAPEVIICCCYDMTGLPTLISCSETDRQGCDTNSAIPGQKCKAHLKGSPKSGGIGDIWNSCLDCPDTFTTTSTTTLSPDGPLGCIKCDEEQPCESPPYVSGETHIPRICRSPSGGTCPPDFEPINAHCSQILLMACKYCEELGVGCEGGCTYECKGGQGPASIPMWQLVSDTCKEGNMDDAVNKDCTCRDVPCGPLGFGDGRCDSVGERMSSGCGSHFCW